jgi:excisionase family DNA binding protein
VTTEAGELHQPDTDRATPAVKLLYTPVEAAQALGIGRSTLYELLADGTIPSVRIGTSRRIRHADLVAYTDALDPCRPGSRVDAARSLRTPSAAIDISLRKEDHH